MVFKSERKGLIFILIIYRHLRLRLSNDIFSPDIHIKILCSFIFWFHACYIFSLSRPLRYDNYNNIWRRIHKNYEALHCTAFAILLLLNSSYAQIYPRQSHLKVPQSVFSRDVVCIKYRKLEHI
jgi:hypothetical protein